MGKEKISNSDLGMLGVNDLELLITFSRAANGMLQRELMDKETVMAHLEALIEDPLPFAVNDDSEFKNIAERIIGLRKEGKFIKQPRTVAQLEVERMDFPIFGTEHIEISAIAQMKTAVQLPIAIAGALMPDAHPGYGLPIGGVLATRMDTIIPYAVGVDIACRMCLSIFDLPASLADSENSKLKTLLLDHTHFGIGSKTKVHFDTTLFDRPEWDACKTIKV